MPFKQFARSVGKAIVPQCLRPESLLAQSIDARTKRTVYAGPFAGMRYCQASVGSVYYPKVLGQYEKELHEFVERIISIKPACVIDIGTAEGYYAVGLAMRIPNCRVVGFEATEDGRELLAEMAGLNNVSNRVTIHGTCEAADLKNAIGQEEPIVVVCDVEGYEKELLDPVAIPALSKTFILVEVHEFASPGIGKILEDRFSQTHTFKRIWQTDRTVADYPFDIWLTKFLPHAYATYRVQEFRPEKMSWLWMEPKGRDSGQ